MEEATRERVRECLDEARRELNFVKQHPYYCCDACGPGGAHTFHACHQAAIKAIRGFLLFHNHEPEETIDLRPLAAADESGFEPLMDIIRALERCGSQSQCLPHGSEPIRSEVEEIVRLTEQLFAFVVSRLPEDVLR